MYNRDGGEWLNYTEQNLESVVPVGHHIYKFVWSPAKGKKHCLSSMRRHGHILFLKRRG